MPISDKKEWLNPKEVFEIYGLTEEYQRTMRGQRRIPFTKVGSSVRYNKAKLDEWMENGSVEVEK